MWWEQKLPELTEADRLEVRLLMGELQLELRQPEEARFAFFEVLNGEVSTHEAARAERGIGLSYFLEGKAQMGVPHLQTAARGLERPAAEEVEYLLAAARGRAGSADASLLARTRPWLEPAGLSAAAVPAKAANTGALVDVTRAQWNAQKMHQNFDPMTKPFRITVHHTAEPLTIDSLAGTSAEVRHIQGMHVQQGWADVGYHFFVDRAGRVIEGRSLEAQGAHAGNSETNRGNIGIALLGNFVAQPERGAEYTHVQTPTSAQMAALDKLVDALMQRYSIPAREIWAHDHFRDTECPGPQLRGWADARRAGRGKPAAAAPAVKPLGANR